MEQESFRNSIGTVDTSGKRVWAYPKKPKGRYYRYRKYVSYLLLAIFFISPFLKIDGNQFLLFNIIERRFNIFGPILASGFLPLCAFHYYRSGLYPALYRGLWAYFLWVGLPTDYLP